MSLLEQQSPGVVMTPDNIRTRKLPVVTNVLVAVAAFVVAAAVVLGLGIGNWVLVAVVGWVLYLVGLSVVAGRIEGRRAARNRTMKSLIYSACVLAILPLASVVWTLVSKGIARLDGNFFGTSMNVSYSRRAASVQARQRGSTIGSSPASATAAVARIRGSASASSGRASDAASA